MVIVLFVLLYNISLVSIKKKHDLKSICCFYFHDFIVTHLLCQHFQMKLNTIWTDIQTLDWYPNSDKTKFVQSDSIDLLFICKQHLLSYRIVFVSPELSSVRDYVITHSVLCMSVVCSMYVYVCGNLQNWSLYPHTLMYSHETWTQWSLDRVTHVTSTDMGQRSSRGQWPLVQVFGKRVSVSTYFNVFSNLILGLQWLQKYVIAKAGETRGSRTALYFIEIGGLHTHTHTHTPTPPPTKLRPIVQADSKTNWKFL